MEEFLIKNAFIIDGTGTPGKISDVLIQNQKIIKIGQNLPETGIKRKIDAKCSVLTPGFIDAHSHSDVSVLAAPEALGKISQGITSEIIGNCGLSTFPISDCNREHLQELYQHYNQKITWNNLTEYRNELNKRQVAVNIFSLCGHNTLRAAVSGYIQKKLNSESVNKIGQLLDQSLKEGAGGLSSGLLYIPGKFADQAELRFLLQKLAKFAKPYTTHLRSEGNTLQEALDEAIQLAANTNLQNLHISHLKIAGKNNWPKIDSVLQQINQAQSNNLTITADRYPYLESMTQLSIILPSPFDDMDDVSLERFLTDSEHFRSLLSALEEYPDERWQTVRLLLLLVIDPVIVQFY